MLMCAVLNLLYNPPNKASGFLSEILFLLIRVSAPPSNDNLSERFQYKQSSLLLLFWFQYSIHKPKQGETISVTVSDGAAFKGSSQNERYSQQFFIFILALMNRGLFVESHGWCNCFITRSEKNKSSDALDWDGGFSNQSFMLMLPADHVPN